MHNKNMYMYIVSVSRLYVGSYHYCFCCFLVQPAKTGWRRKQQKQYDRRLGGGSRSGRVRASCKISLQKERINWDIWILVVGKQTKKTRTLMWSWY